MTLKDRHALASLPAEIEALEGRVARLRALLADPEFYACHTAMVPKATSEFADGERALAAAEARWLDLALLAEELGG
jgi:ATP-binding cassette subfamily F protein uup